MEAELDYFSAHTFDLKEDKAPEPVIGKHDHELKLAKGIRTIGLADSEEFSK
jgi:hypothetical protein